MFYTYNQNNSGGVFVQDTDRGISHYVIVEAHTASMADALAESIGLYFDGCNAGLDCPCCGDRWYSNDGWGDSGEAVPTIYGNDVSNSISKNGEWHIKWMDGPEGYIHYLDGTVKPIDFED